MGTDICSVTQLYVLVDSTAVCTQLRSRHPLVNDMRLRRGFQSLLDSSEYSSLNGASASAALILLSVLRLAFSLLLPSAELVILENDSLIHVKNLIYKGDCSRILAAANLVILFLHTLDSIIPSDRV